MPVQTLTPRARRGSLQNSAAVGGSDPAILTDGNTTTTYLDCVVDTTAVTLYGTAAYDLTTFTLPAGAQVRSIVGRLTHAETSLVGNYLNLSAIIQDIDPATNNDYGSGGLLAGSTATVMGNGPAVTQRSDGQPFTQVDIDRLGLNIYTSNWSGSGGSSRIKVFEAAVDVTYNQAPTATGTGPNANVGAARPVFTWTYSDPEGDAQERFRIKVFSAAQYSAAGFDPNTATPAVDSGEIFSSATSWTCNTDLTNGVSYRAYVFVADVGSNGRYNIVTSTGPYATCTIAMSAPAAPRITVVQDLVNMRNVLTLQDTQNMLGADDAGFEATVGSWVSQVNCSVARSTAQFEDGLACLAITATAAGVLTAGTGLQANVTAGKVYTARAALRPNTTARSVRVDIQWFNASNGLISTLQGPVITQATGQFNPVFVTGTAPAGTTQAKVAVELTTAAGAGEIHYLDDVVLVAGALNMLDDPAFEVDANADGVADDWTSSIGSGQSATYAMDTARVYAGLSAQKITLIGDGTNYAGITQANRGVVSGQAYTVTAVVWADQPCTFSMFHPEFGNYEQAVTPGGWQTITHTFTGSATAFDVFSARIKYAGTVSVWIGALQLELGATASPLVLNRKNWVRGGLLSLARLDVQRSTDGGATWTALTRLFWQPGSYNYSTQDYSDITQQMVLNDYEAPRNVAVLYRARIKATVGTVLLASQWSAWTSAGSQPLKGWWLKAVYNDQLNVQVFMGSETLDWSSDETQGVFYPQGRKNAVVLSDVVHGEQVSIQLSFLDEASYTAFKTLRDARVVMLVQEPYGSPGSQRFARFGKTRTSSHLLNPNGTRKRIVKIPLIETDAPA